MPAKKPKVTRAVTGSDLRLTVTYESAAPIRATVTDGQSGRGYVRYVIPPEYRGKVLDYMNTLVRLIEAHGVEEARDA